MMSRENPRRSGRAPYVGAFVHVQIPNSPERPVGIVTHVHGPGHKWAGSVNLHLLMPNGTASVLEGSFEDGDRAPGHWFWADEACEPVGYA